MANELKPEWSLEFLWSLHSASHPYPPEAYEIMKAMYFAGATAVLKIMKDQAKSPGSSLEQAGLLHTRFMDEICAFSDRPEVTEVVRAAIRRRREEKARRAKE